MKLNQILESANNWSDLSPQKCKSLLRKAAGKVDGRIFNDQGWKALSVILKDWDRITDDNVTVISNEYYKDDKGNLLGKKWWGIIAHYPPPPKITGNRPIDKLAKSHQKRRPTGSAFVFNFAASIAINAPGDTSKYECNVHNIEQIKWKDIDYQHKDGIEKAWREKYGE